MLHGDLEPLWSPMQSVSSLHQLGRSVQLGEWEVTVGGGGCGRICTSAPSPAYPAPPTSKRRFVLVTPRRGHLLFAVSRDDKGGHSASSQRGPCGTAGRNRGPALGPRFPPPFHRGALRKLSCLLSHACSPLLATRAHPGLGGNKKFKTEGRSFSPCPLFLPPPTVVFLP